MSSINNVFFGTKCSNFTVFLSLLFLYPVTLPPICWLSLSAPLSVIPPSCFHLCSLLWSFFLLSPFHSFGACLGSLFPFLFFLPSFFLHQIFKLFLVYTSLIPLPQSRLMAPTVGFSPPLCHTHIPHSANMAPLFNCLSAVRLQFVFSCAVVSRAVTCS